MSDLHDAIESAIKEHCAGGDLFAKHFGAPPAPVAEIREVAVTDEMCDRICRAYVAAMPELVDTAKDGRAMIAAVRSELGPTLGIIEIREPTPEECERICAAYFVDKTPASHVVPLGRAMASAVRAGLRPAFGLIQPMEPTPEVERKDYALTAIIQIAERRPDCTDILTIARAARLPEKD